MTRYVLFLLGIVLLFLAACADMPLTAEPTEFVAVVEERDGEETAVSPTSAPTIFPTRTLAPTATSTTQPTETATMLPTPMPTLSIRVEAGTAVPHSHQPITTDNVTQLTELARWGRGVINDIALSGNGRWLAVR